MVRLRKIITLVTAIVVCQLAGMVGALFTVPAVGGWYASLNKPALNPPGWVFGPVWTLLYFLMGLALYLVWVNQSTAETALPTVRAELSPPLARRKAVIIFFVQLALNAFWSIIFFGLHSPGWALVEIIMLWLAIVATIFYFAKISRLAAWLFALYMAWVTFAVYLNFAIWMVN